ncbi:MAG: FmdB family transcriptional regulator [Desulfobacteraceae bacterium 4572_19]|nr:MAG: FmdB family transcriptional regulator [Desulfobacteraceae bacterium 4572_19]
MPIYEFKCTKCEEFFELLVMNNDPDEEIQCPKCHAQEFERVLSTTNYSVGSSSGANQQKVTSETRTCSSGSCNTYTIPGE